VKVPAIGIHALVPEHSSASCQAAIIERNRAAFTARKDLVAVEGERAYLG
jgi:hypothetical protein